jgi:hypothetical protein
LFDLLYGNLCRILRFTEYNFGMPEIAPPYYADANTLDSANNNIPLSDFFSVSNQRNFTIINNFPYGPNFLQDLLRDFTEWGLPSADRPGRNVGGGGIDGQGGLLSIV